MLFNSTIEVVHQINFNEIDLKNIPMLYRADCDFAWKQKNALIDLLLYNTFHCFSRAWKYYSIDTRSHMLMKHWYPCIPGWHCDDFYRPTNTQPDLMNVLQNAPQEHIMLILGDCSRTQFLKNPIELPIITPSDNKPIYGLYNQIINSLEPEILTVEPGQIVKFAPTDFHRGVAATHPGWRFFFRITGSNHRKPKNELRTQTQVYLESVSNGW